MEMIRKLILGTFLLSFSAFSQASLISFDTTITGADMDGMSVTATFINGGSETLFWQTTSTTLGSSGNDIIDHEGFGGGVEGELSDWGLSQNGYTFGDHDISTDTLYGLWTFSDLLGVVAQLEINTFGTNIVFDTVSLENGDVDTNGSGTGRYFITDYTGVSAAYNDPFSGDAGFEELYQTLTLTFANPSAPTNFQFMADTDAVTDVPEPSILFLFASGLLGFAGVRRKLFKSSGK